MKLSLAYIAFAAMLGFTMAFKEETITFTPTNIPGYFVEQFTDDWTERWTPSQATKEENGGEVFSYRGAWSVEEPKIYPGIPGDKGLVAKTKAAHHAISAPFATIDNKDKTLVVQYEVKLGSNLECGGAYLKLLSESPAGIESEHFSDKTPYTIMFGPDKCGSNTKIHFIFRHQNPLTGEYEEKHMRNLPVPPTADMFTHVYRLTVRPDQSFDVAVDGKSVASGSLLEDFNPPVNPPKEIDDPSDKKPDDWVDESTIRDPNAVKPDDWDEDAPMKIPDPDAVKPDGWLDDEPLTVPDPDAIKPEDWDDEDDGDWEAPLVSNPLCKEAPGCGEWTVPLIDNPNYKGKWFAPFINNPDYKGPWAPRKIPNENYFEDLTPSHFTPIKGIGFEIWTMDEDILFDNIFISDSEADADKFIAETYSKKHEIEQKAFDAEVEKAAKEKEAYDPAVVPPPSAKEDPIKFARHHVQKFVDAAVVDPVAAFKQYPQTGAALGLSAALLVGLIGFLLSATSKKAHAEGSKTKKVDPAVTIALEKNGDNVAEAEAEAEAKSSSVKPTAGDSEVTKRKSTVAEK